MTNAKTEQLEQLLLETLIEEYASDPNCRPLLWIESVRIADNIQAAFLQDKRVMDAFSVLYVEKLEKARTVNN